MWGAPRVPTVGRPLLTVLSLVVLPGAALGYLGYQALVEKAASLRTSYTATISLVRDRLAAEMARLEADLVDDLRRSGISAEDTVAAASVLHRVTSARPWLRSPFLLEADGDLVIGDITAGSPRRMPPAPRGFAEAVAAAETAEFIAQDLDLALREYQRAQRLAGTSPAHGALAGTRLGRTLLKMRRLPEAIAAYQAVLQLPSETGRDGLPFAVIALLQLTDAYEQLSQPDARRLAKRDLLRFVVEHPWDLDDGYAHYLGRAAALDAGESSLSAKAQSRLDVVERAESLRAALRGRAFEHPSDGLGRDIPRRLRIDHRGTPVPITYWSFLAESEVSQAVVGYEILPDYVAGPLLADVLQTVDLGRDFQVAVVGAGSPTSSTGETLADADLQAILPGWKVSLFDVRGRSITELVRRERRLYGSLVGGMLIVMVAGGVAAVRASSRAAELARLQREFVANVSHELKTPLALIRMFGETLESGLVADEAQRQDFYGIIRRESDRLTHLINNVLDVGRIDAGTKQYTFHEDDLVGTVRDALDAYRPLFERQGFEVTEILPPGPVVMPLDRHALVQAVVNLFQNVIKYSADRKSVSVSVVADGADARVSVADRGVGIPRDRLSRVFDRYYRVPTDGPTGSSGSGLGLSIVRHAIDAHGGRVEVESAPGEGSVFTLVLPRHGVGLRDVEKATPKAASA